jgi:hydrogenase maturation protease
LLRDHLPESGGVTIKEHWFGGFSLAEAMAGFDRAILVDAARTLNGKPGTVSKRSLAQLDGMQTLAAEGEFDLRLAMDSWRKAGLRMPASVEAWGIEARDTETHGPDLTAPVARGSIAAALAIFSEISAAEDAHVKQAA